MMLKKIASAGICIWLYWGIYANSKRAVRIRQGDRHKSRILHASTLFFFFFCRARIESFWNQLID